MDGIFILLGLIVIATPAAVIYLLISNASLRSRVNALESKGLGRETAPDLDPESAPDTSDISAPLPNPWLATQPDPDAAPEQSDPTLSLEQRPPKAVVFRLQKARAFVSWLTQNWFYAVSAVSLALAGVFLVIYGIENGLLPPSIRILASITFGCVLIASGELIRRRFGDGDDKNTAYLPSVFSSAGIVTLFGSVLSARLLYDFISPDIALIALAFVGLCAIVLGWFYGPLLAAIGVAGAMVSPLIIGGSSDDPSTLLAYFGIITFVGLAIDTIRRWAWVSVLSLILGFGAGYLLMLGAGDVVKPYFILYCAALVIAAIALPVRRWTPDHSGSSLGLMLFAHQKSDPWPEFPTRVAGGAIIAASVLIVMAFSGSLRADLFWLAIVVLSGLTLAILVWGHNAPALIDLIVVPAAAMLVVIPVGEPIWHPLAEAAKLPEAKMPLMVSIIVTIGLLLTLCAAWRSIHRAPSQMLTALLASVLAPSVAIVIEATWHPSVALGPYIWALHAMVIAAIMVAIAARFATADGPDFRERVSFATLAALASITFAIVILFSEAALTFAIVVTVVAAAWLDRRFNLPLMGLYNFAGITTIGYRLVVDPGLDWATDAKIADMVLSYAGTLLAFIAAYVLIKPKKRPRSQVLLESAVFSSAGLLLSLVLYRVIQDVWALPATTTHWSLGIGATIWAILGMTQLRRLEIGGVLWQLRVALSVGFLIISAGLLLFVTTLLNPLIYANNNLVLGPVILNSLVPAYLLPAASFGFGAWWLGAIPHKVRVAFGALAVALAALWLGLTIRHFWRGATGMEWPGINQPELYSYTIALLIIGALLFYQSLAKQSAGLRFAGLIVIGMAVAKVFALDIQGLGGLIRVFSLLFLGLSLAGLAWLNRWASTRSNAQSTATPPE